MKAIGCHSLATWDVTWVVTCHPTQVNTPRLNPSKKAGIQFQFTNDVWVYVLVH